MYKKKLLISQELFAGPTGIEPATSGLTGRRSNQAELRSQIFKHFSQDHCFEG